MPTIAPDGRQIVFVRSRSGTDRAGLLWRYDVATGSEELLADPHDLLAGDDEDLPAAERLAPWVKELAAGTIRLEASEAVLDRLIEQPATAEPADEEPASKEETMADKVAKFAPTEIGVPDARTSGRSGSGAARRGRAPRGLAPGS